MLGNVCDDEQHNHYHRRRRALAGIQGQSTAILGRAPRGSRQVSQPEYRPPHAMRSTRSVLIPHRRLIATYYLLDITSNTYIPNTWEARRLWQGRMVYTAIRDSLNIEKHLMFICQSWRRASEYFYLFSAFFPSRRSFSLLPLRYRTVSPIGAHVLRYCIYYCAARFLSCSLHLVVHRTALDAANLRRWRGRYRVASDLLQYDTALLFCTALGTYS